MTALDDLMREEDMAWAAFRDACERAGPAMSTERGVVGEWSVKDLIGHVACWMADAAQLLERMRMGTYVRPQRDVDELNRRFYESLRDLDLPTIKAECAASRNRMLQELAALPEIDDEARTRFRESGVVHYREHLEQLERWLAGGP